MAFLSKQRICIGRVFKAFHRNQGLLLSGAVAYYSLLSIVPTLAIFLIILSKIMPEEQLLPVMNNYLEMIVPGQSIILTKEILNFLPHWKLLSTIGVVVLIIFSAMAFTVLEKAISVIFYHRFEIHRRHFLVSAIIPFTYMAFLATGLLILTFINSAMQSSKYEEMELMGYQMSMGQIFEPVFYGLSVIGMVLLFTSIYLVMPVGKIIFRHAFTGGLVAAMLWEVTRHILVWYYAKISFVNVIYGSFATTIFALISMEIASIIVLLGAQVIATYELHADDVDQEPEIPSEKD